MISFDYKSSTINNNFSGIYAKVKYIDKNNLHNHTKDFQGNDKITPEKFSFPLDCSGNKTILVSHKKPTSIKVENHQKGKMINPYLVKTGRYFSGNYRLVQVSLPQSITATTAPRSIVPLTTVMVSTPSTDTSSAFPSYPAALASLLVTGVLLTQ